jgi:hypothetical protein
VVSSRKKRSTPEKLTLIIWALLVRDDAAAYQNELKPEPEKTDRDALKNAGLIRCEKRGRRIWLQVTDDGWEWAGRNLGATLPANSRAGSQILRGWLMRLQAFMEARGFVLADILGLEEFVQTKLAGESLSPAHCDYGALRERIRQAYLDITGGRLNTPAMLTDVREKLKDIDQATLDGALMRMHLEEGTTLSGLNNPREITQAIRDAGLDFKGERMFVLWITK